MNWYHYKNKRWYVDDRETANTTNKQGANTGSAPGSEWIKVVKRDGGDNSLQSPLTEATTTTQTAAAATGNDDKSLQRAQVAQHMQQAFNDMMAKFDF